MWAAQLHNGKATLYAAHALHRSFKGDANEKKRFRYRSFKGDANEKKRLRDAAAFSIPNVNSKLTALCAAHALHRSFKGDANEKKRLRDAAAFSMPKVSSKLEMSS